MPSRYLALLGLLLVFLLFQFQFSQKDEEFFPTNGIVEQTRAELRGGEAGLAGQKHALNIKYGAVAELKDARQENEKDARSELKDEPPETLRSEAGGNESDEPGYEVQDSTASSSSTEAPKLSQPSSEGADSVQEQLRKRSLDAKLMVGEQLKDIIVTPPTPQYRHHQHKLDTQKNENNNLSCDQEDAFVGIPTEGWIPPGHHPAESVKKWDREYKLSVQQIKEFSVGGKELRQLAKEEVLRLRDLRHQLFCEDE